MDGHRDHSRSLCGAMRRGAVRLAALALVSWAFGPAQACAQQRTSTASLVFDGVTVVDVEHGQLVPGQRVVLVGNRIQTVGKAGTVRVPSGARVVDAHGKYLIPGLWDMHTHSRRYTDFFYPLFVANGVTGIRDAGSEVPLDTLLLWRREILVGTRVGPPRQFLGGQAIDEERPCTRGKTMHTCVADSADARHLVDSLKAAGADFIKMYGLGKEMYFVIAAEARRVGIPFGGHLDAASALDASDSGAGILDHVNTGGGIDTLCLGSAATVERCQMVAERFRRNNTWWVPTVVRRGGNGQPHTGPASQSLLTRFYQFAKEFWAGTVLHRVWLRDSTHVENTASAPHPGSTGAASGDFLHLMQRASLPILAGTDAGAPVMAQKPPGFSLHTEMAMYVAEGLTPLEALQTATLNPAKYLHGTDSLGTVAPGKLADLVLLDADPLQDITNTATIRGVVANGRYFDRAALDQLLAEVQAKAKQEPQPLGTARERQ